MARPPVDDVARNILVNFKVSDDELNQLNELVKVTGTNRATLLRKAIKIIWSNAVKVKKRNEEKAREMFKKEGKLNFDLLNRMNEMFQKDMEQELNNMVYKECMENIKEKDVSKDKK